MRFYLGYIQYTEEYLALQYSLVFSHQKHLHPVVTRLYKGVVPLRSERGGYKQLNIPYLSYRLPHRAPPGNHFYGYRSPGILLSLTGVDFTRRSRPVFTSHSRSVFTRRDRPVFTTHRRPVFTTVAESLPRPQWERNSEHGADPHEHLHRNHLSIASEGK